MICFERLLYNVKFGDPEAQEALLQMYKPLLIKNSIVNNRFDEDLYQVLCCTFFKCVDLFSI